LAQALRRIDTILNPISGNVSVIHRRYSATCQAVKSVVAPIMTKGSAAIIGLVLLGAPLNAGERLATRMWPSFAVAPGAVRVRATVEANADNRAIRIVVDSPGFYRSSEIPLNGEQAPRTTVVDFASLPAGTYQVVTTLIDVHDRTTAMQQFIFVCR
jgi:hypothetical protein